MELSNFLSEIYPSLFERAVEAFPEFAFEPLPEGKGYRSGNRLKIDGSQGNRQGVVYYYADTCFGLKDYTRGFVSIYNYVKQRDGLDDEQAVTLLARLAGKPLPARAERSPEQEAEYRRRLRGAELLEEANTFFVHCLSHRDNVHAHTPRAAALREYLLQKRGYTVSVLRLPNEDYRPGLSPEKMELGFVPEQKYLHYHLHQAGYTDEEIAEHLTFPKGMRPEHCLSIPYRDRTGMVRGFGLRYIGEDAERLKIPKYLYTQGLERGGILLGLRRKASDVVLVEGMLDALHASALGLPGVAALGGAHLTEGQLQELLRLQPDFVTLCLDNDQAGLQGTERALDKLLPHSLQIRIYIAQLPPEVKDLDELLVKQGVEAARHLLRQAPSVAQYLHGQLLAEVAALEKSRGGKLPDKDFDAFLLRIAQTELRLLHPLDVHRFRQLVLESFAKYLTTPEILAYKTEELRQIALRKRYEEALKGLHRQAGEALYKGDVGRVEQLYTEQFRRLRSESQAGQFLPLLHSPDEDALKRAFANRPPSLDTGYRLTQPTEELPLLLPQGAVSFFCAPTSHGKTTMLINLLLNIARLYPDKTFHFFSYEEAQEAIFLKTLNAYLDLDLGSNNAACLEQYFRTNDVQSVFLPSQAEFLRSKELFFNELINSKRLFIHYVDYNSQELIDAIHYLHRQDRVGAVLVDYMQLLKLPDDKKQRLSRQEELKQICIDLKDCAVATGLPLVLGAQFNREVTNHLRLHATKIGEAGDIERIASVIVGMWNNDFDPIGVQLGEEAQLDELRRPGSIYVKLLKNRGGRVGGWSLLPYDGNRGKIYAAEPANAAYNKGSVVRF